MGLKVTLKKSFAGASDSQLKTLTGLGLRKMNQSRVLQDTPSVRGMVFKVSHLVASEKVSEEPKAHSRRKPRKIVQRDRSRAAAEQQK